MPRRTEARIPDIKGLARRETRSQRGVFQVRCPKCGEWAPLDEWFLRDGGTRLYAHKKDEIARSGDSHRKTKAAKDREQLAPRKRPMAKRSTARKGTAKR